MLWIPTNVAAVPVATRKREAGRLSRAKGSRAVAAADMRALVALPAARTAVWRERGARQRKAGSRGQGSVMPPLSQSAGLGEILIVTPPVLKTTGLIGCLGISIPPTGQPSALRVRR